HRVFLQVVPDTRYVGVNLIAVGQAHARDLAQRRIRLLGRSRLHLRANAAFLRRSLQSRRAHLVALLDTRLAYKLINCRHVSYGSQSGAVQRPPLSYTSSDRPEKTARRLAPSRPPPPQGGITSYPNKPPRAQMPLGSTLLINAPLARCQPPAAAGASARSPLPSSSSPSTASASTSTLL